MFASPRVTWSALLLMGVAYLVGCNQERNESIRHMNRGLELYNRKKVGEAIDELKLATESDPKNDRAFFYQGLIQYQRTGALDPALKAISRAIELNKNDYEYPYHRGVILTKKKEWKAAADSFEQAIELKPDHAESHLRLGLSLDHLEKYDRAQEEYVAAIKSNPRLPEAYNALGGLYLRFDQFSHAAHVLKNAVENNPDWALNYHDLGLVYQAQKRYDDALVQFKKAQALDPGNAGVLFNLGITYAASDNPKLALLNLKTYLTRKVASEDRVRVQIARDIIDRLEMAENQPKQ